MNRLIRGFAAAGPPRRLLAALLLLMLLVPGAPGVQADVPARVPYCYGWDFMNLTGADADDLHIALRGIRAVAASYAGSGNPFGAPRPGSGYDAAGDAYRLHYEGGPAVDAAPAALGICAGNPVLRLASGGAASAFYWTLGGRAASPAPLFLGVGWARLASGGLRITLYNDQGAGLVIWSAALLEPDAPLPLDDLDGATVATLPALFDLLAAPAVVPAGGSLAVDLPASALSALAPDAALVLAVEFSGESDLDGLAHLYAQLSALQRSYLPLIQR